MDSMGNQQFVDKPLGRGPKSRSLNKLCDLSRNTVFNVWQREAKEMQSWE